MATRGPAAQCVGVRRTYFTQTVRVDALQGVDAVFPRAAVTAVVGASGSGKSSLLRLLAGLDRPTSGKVLVEGRDLGALPETDLRRLRRRVVGYVFQRPADNFIPYLTIDEHVALAYRARGVRAHRGAEILDALELLHAGRRRPAELSGGEQQRAAFACALAAGPRLVVADEPTAELDGRSGERVLLALRRLADDGIGVVVATHDRAIVPLADELVELAYGVAASGRAGLRLPRPARLAGEVRALPRRERASSPDPAPLVEVRAVGKTFSRGGVMVEALRNVSLQLHPGRLIGLVGRSGSGKTTLVNVLAAWERPDAGAVFLRWNGGAHPSGASWRDLAVVPQKFGLVEEFTVRENIEYPARLQGSLASERPRVESLLGELDLAELGPRFPAETSVGQQQRAALARALTLRPRLLLADEPTGHQDAASAARVLEALRRAAASGSCCLVATHDARLARSFDTVFEIENGRVSDARPSA
ncbi:MAG: ATP-binding cassette domain-containing protein [Actinomycetota bacterium]|nr:ATP-binding cassette domain-containing protein [Actinomycetota bacterium]